MAKLTAELLGVVEGEVYPRLIAAGEDCPPELEAAALALGILEVAEVVPKVTELVTTVAGVATTVAEVVAEKAKK